MANYKEAMNVYKFIDSDGNTAYTIFYYRINIYLYDLIFKQDV